MELVPSAVGPSEIEQRCKIAAVRTLRGGVQRRGTRLWGRVIDKRPAPEASCPPAAQAKKVMDLQDPSSASVSALIKRDCNRELAEGELASCPWGLPARKRQRAERMCGSEQNKGYGLPRQLSFSLLKFVPRNDTRLCSALKGKCVRAVQ